MPAWSIEVWAARSAADETVSLGGVRGRSRHEVSPRAARADGAKRRQVGST